MISPRIKTNVLFLLICERFNSLDIIRFKFSAIPVVSIESVCQLALAVFFILSCSSCSTAAAAIYKDVLLNTDTSATYLDLKLEAQLVAMDGDSDNLEVGPNVLKFPSPTLTIAWRYQ